MKCSACKKQITEKDCCYVGLHYVGDCWGRVFFNNGREFLGQLKPINMRERKNEKVFA